jgi:hypothetical protein
MPQPRLTSALLACEIEFGGAPRAGGAASVVVTGPCRISQPVAVPYLTLALAGISSSTVGLVPKIPDTNTNA